MGHVLVRHRSELVSLTRQFSDPLVRHRAHVLLDTIDSPSIRVSAERMGVSVTSIYRWRKRFLAEGEAGLCDRPRPGRPSRLSPAARDFLCELLDGDPMALAIRPRRGRLPI